jgi:hypothetical protein
VPHLPTVIVPEILRRLVGLGRQREDERQFLHVEPTGLTISHVVFYGRAFAPAKLAIIVEHQIFFPLGAGDRS